MEFDWDAATISVKVPVQHTAVKETQDITIPLPQFATMLLDLHSRHVRQEMARKAVQRKERALCVDGGHPTASETDTPANQNEHASRKIDTGEGPRLPPIPNDR